VNDAISPSAELTAELFERSAVVVDLSPAEVDAWCSGLWLAWESDQEVLDFVAYCDAQGGAVAALVCRSLARLGSAPIADEAARVAANHAGAAGDKVAALADPAVIEAWQVTGPGSQSIVVGCGYGETSDHAVLVELDGDGELTDLLLAGDPHELVYGVQRAPEPDDATEAGDDSSSDRSEDEATGLEGLAVVPLQINDAIETISTVWRRAATSAHEWPSTVRSNEHVVRQRVDSALPPLQYERLELDLQRGLSDDEFRDANRAALSTLQSALRVSADELLAEPPRAEAAHAVEAAWVAVIRGDTRGLPIEEQRAIVFLEWADWLGAGIGMVRGGVNGLVDGERLVDHVNRCPEVSTSIDKRDRGYAAFAFDVALELVADAGGIEDGTLTAEGHAALPRAMARAWSETA